MRSLQNVRAGAKRRLLAADPVWQRLHSVLKLQRPLRERTVAKAALPVHVTHGIVLGAKVYPDGTISQVLRERLERAVELATVRPDLVLLVSGDGTVESGAEDQAMKADLVAHGIDPARITCDPRGNSTRETMSGARARGIASAVVVTNDFHAARAVDTAVRTGIDAYVIADFDCSSYSDADRPLKLDEQREQVAHLKDWAALAVRRPWRAVKRPPANQR